MSTTTVRTGLLILLICLASDSVLHHIGPHSVAAAGSTAYAVDKVRPEQVGVALQNRAAGGWELIVAPAWFDSSTARNSMDSGPWVMLIFRQTASPAAR